MRSAAGPPMTSFARLRTSVTASRTTPRAGGARARRAARRGRVRAALELRPPRGAAAAAAARRGAGSRATRPTRAPRASRTTAPRRGRRGRRPPRAARRQLAPRSCHARACPNRRRRRAVAAAARARRANPTAARLAHTPLLPTKTIEKGATRPFLSIVLPRQRPVIWRRARTLDHAVGSQGAALVDDEGSTHLVDQAMGARSSSLRRMPVSPPASRSVRPSRLRRGGGRSSPRAAARTPRARPRAAEPPPLGRGRAAAPNNLDAADALPPARSGKPPRPKRTKVHRRAKARSAPRRNSAREGERSRRACLARAAACRPHVGAKRQRRRSRSTDCAAAATCSPSADGAAFCWRVLRVRRSASAAAARRRHRQPAGGRRVHIGKDGSSSSARSTETRRGAERWRTTDPRGVPGAPYFSR